MVKKKEKKDLSSYDELFLLFTNPKDKHKNLLESMKSTLIMQDEYLKLSNVRKEKIQTLNEIKKNLSKLNQKYQELKKKLPNVKNIVEYTERELEDLEIEEKELKDSEKQEEKDISSIENIKENYKLKNKLELKKKIKNNNKNKFKKKEIINKYNETTSIKSISKLDRIKNNLKYIEEKLKELD